jgi:hypothetical protein
MDHFSLSREYHVGAHEGPGHLRLVATVKVPDRGPGSVGLEPSGEEGAQSRKYPVDNSGIVEVSAYASRPKH